MIVRCALLCALAVLPARGAGAEGKAGAAGKGRIAVVIDDFGLTYPKDVPDEDWMKLPWPVTFAVMPKSPRTRTAAAETVKAGHELIIHFPFDPFLSLELPKGGQPSPKDQDKVSALLKAAIETVPGAVGLNNHRSFRATQNAALMRWFMAKLKPTGLYFLDSKVGPKSTAYAEAKAAGLRSAVNGIFLDGTREPKARHAKNPAALEEAVLKDKAACVHYLRLAASRAKREGQAVAIGHHYFHGTYRCLRDEVPKLQAEGFEFVFGSAIAATAP